MTGRPIFIMSAKTFPYLLEKNAVHVKSDAARFKQILEDPNDKRLIYVLERVDYAKTAAQLNEYGFYDLGIDLKTLNEFKALICKHEKESMYRGLHITAKDWRVARTEFQLFDIYSKQIPINDTTLDFGVNEPLAHVINLCGITTLDCIWDGWIMPPLIENNGVIKLPELERHFIIDE